MRFFLLFVFLIWLALAAMSARIFRDPIEVALTREARATLDRLELEMVVVEFDHLDATLSGNVASRRLKETAAAAVEAIDGARVARCGGAGDCSGESSHQHGDRH